MTQSTNISCKLPSKEVQFGSTEIYRRELFWNALFLLAFLIFIFLLAVDKKIETKHKPVELQNAKIDYHGNFQTLLL